MKDNDGKRSRGHVLKNLFLHNSWKSRVIIACVLYAYKDCNNEKLQNNNNNYDNDINNINILINNQCY